MLGIDNLNKRLQYHGGNAEQRFINDKLKTLKKSLLYSYQAATLKLNDGREFRCLINEDKLSTDYDNKILSIPYDDVCLNPDECWFVEDLHELDHVGLQCGDTFLWKETNTHWLVYLQYIEEDAYFRAQIRKCEQETEINGQKYWTYIRGPVETSVVWNQKAGVEWNDLNYSLVMYVTRDENTLNNLHRFTKLKIVEPGTNIYKTWQVVAVNPYQGDNIIEVMLDEYFENTIQDKVDKENKQKEILNKPVKHDKHTPYIEGPTEVKGYSMVHYTIHNNHDRGEWYVIENNKEYLRHEVEPDLLHLEIVKKTGKFKLEYRVDGEAIAALDIVVIGI